MKKFVLHCNRCTIVTRLFNLNFARVEKEGNPVMRLISKKRIFLSEPANCLVLDQLGRNFPTVQNISGKEEKTLFN